MPVESSQEHPTFELGGNTITSYAAPSRGADEAAIFRIDMPAGGRLPRHHHDHFDVFVVAVGDGTAHLGDTQTKVVEGDSVVVPTGEWHFFVAGENGASLVVTMLGGTKQFREDGSVIVPPWVS